MKKLTVEDAIELRNELKGSKYTHSERTVIVGILRGDYDRYKDNASTIAKEDLEFLSKDDEKINSTQPGK
jgi:hypothetical protein